MRTPQTIDELCPILSSAVLGKSGNLVFFIIHKIGINGLFHAVVVFDPKVINVVILSHLFTISKGNKSD